MGKDLLEASPAAREVFARADAALGEPLTKLILEGPEAELTLTANAQPALVTMSTAVLAALRERYPAFPAPRFTSIPMRTSRHSRTSWATAGDSGGVSW